MIQVLVVDDHQLVIDGIRSLLKEEEDITCSGFANSGKDALRKLQDHHFDVVLLDINMPEMDGLKACDLILNQFPQMKVIALTMLGERSMIKAMVNAGAKGYLLKNVGQEELVRAIKRVHLGKSHYSEEIAEILLSPETKQELHHSVLPKLSSREKQILQLIIDEFTTTQISEELHISTNTVETHRRNIMHKLGAKNTAGMVRIAIEQQLVK
jgi:DNA-binding NarL/FixJ family response regulator